MPAEIGYYLQGGRGGFLDYVWDGQTHSGPTVILAPDRKNLARMNGTPQPNQKWLPRLGIEPGSHNLKPQFLTILPFLIPEYSSIVLLQSHLWVWEQTRQPNKQK